MNPLLRATLTTSVLAVCSLSTSAYSQSSGACVDSDGDGYGWNGSSTCLVNAPDNSQSGAACVDSDGDGYGWNGSSTCLVGATNQPAQLQADQPSAGCVDSDGDGYGWNALTMSTCLVNNLGNLSGSGSADLGLGNLAGSGSADLGSNGNDSNGGGQPNGGVFNSDNPGGTTFTSTFSPVSNVQADQCLTRQDTINRQYPGSIRAGDFILSINAWNFGAAGNYEWEQCIYANNNTLGWNYDWGAGGGAGDYFVRSYPELIFGVKSGGEISGSTAREETGLPERIDRLPFISIDYSFTSTQSGPNRPVEVSLNPRFPKGTTISGERNIAVESFFHPSDANGNCPASVVQRGNGQSNHTYEIMVWLDSGAERLPAGPNDYVTTVTLDGARYDVYTKDNDRKYVAFVRVNPNLTGTLNWSTFIEWTSNNAHRVSELYGANTDSVKLQDNWCLANILVGNEIWWGKGNFNINQWQINRTY